MISQIPLYPRRRRLKDVLKTYEPNTILLDETTINSNAQPNDTISFDALLLVSPQHAQLYRLVVNHYYYAEIGFDSDEQFVQRFSSVYYNYGKVYAETLKKAIAYKGNTETLTIDGTNKNTVDLTDDTKNTGADTYTYTGDVEYQKGTTTLSMQSTDNTGNKLTRSTPNEDMRVVGTATNTVKDEGSDKDVYNKTDTHTLGTASKTVKSGDTTLKVDTTNERTNLTLNDILLEKDFESIIDDFINKFHNLFMEVFD